MIWAAEVEHFRANGWLVTPPLYDDEFLAKARVEIERIWRERTALLPPGDDFALARPELQRLHLDSDVLSAFCRHEPLVTLAGALLGGQLDLSFNQAYAKAPGGDPRTEIPWHQDGFYAEIDGPSCNCWVAITPATVASGAMSRAPITPGIVSHVWDPRLTFFRCDIDDHLATPVELSPGQVFVFDGKLPHRSGINRSGEARIGYSVSFAAAGARLRANGEAFGDRAPVLRGGRPVREVLADYSRSPADESHPGARLLRDIEDRAPLRADEAHRLFRSFAGALRAGDGAAADRDLGRLIAIMPHQEKVLGDLPRSRARVDHLLAELATIRGTDERAERMLLQRILELEPDHEFARIALGSHRS
jgi:ectoine hydroxylase-related dioxygenase (phytanoyl-CoA dioxygenase family)